MEQNFIVYPIRVDNQTVAKELLTDLGVWKHGIEIMAPKSQHYAIKVGPMSPQAAQIIKQEMLSKGGEAATHGEVLKGRKDTFVILFGTLAQFRRVLPKLSLQPFRLAQLGKELEFALDNLVKPNIIRDFQCGSKWLTLGRRTLVMGILNITPDSFSDGGSFMDPQVAVERALEMEEQGADIIDIGAESTRPGSQRVSGQEERARLLPVLTELARKVKVPISVDTYKASTARAALENGADIINDISGSADTEMNCIAAMYNVPFIIMHSVPETRSNIIEGVIFTLQKKKIQAIADGVKEENIILDPGIGFSKNVQENLEVINRLDSIKCLGCPILVGTSRKSTIGKVLDLPPGERLHGTSATVAAAILRGASIVRVHDVKEMYQVAKMTDAILGIGELPNG